MRVQVPTVPVRLQLWQAAEHPVLQQTPCWQKAETHSSPTVQVTPFSFFTHWPALQR